MKPVVLALILGLVACCAAPLHAQTDPYAPGARLRFALSLLRQGALAPARHEALQLLALHPASPQADSARLVLGVGYLQADSLPQAHTWLAQLPDHPAFTHWKRWGAGLLALHTDAHAPLQLGAPHPAEPAAALPGAQTVLLRQWDDYQLYASQLGTGDGGFYGPMTLAVDHYQAHPAKRPWLAALLGLALPGAGKAYVGQWGAVLGTFLATTAIGLVAWEGFRKDNPALAWSAVGIGGLFHLSQAYTSALNARAHNLQREAVLDNAVWQCLDRYARSIYRLY